LNKLDEAIRDLNAVIALDPSDSESYVSRGNVFLKLGRAREAILDFTKAIELDNEEIDAYLGRAQAYKSLGMELEAKTKKLRTRLKPFKHDSQVYEY
jgi:Tfp pilus assembly protein PilF